MSLLSGLNTAASALRAFQETLNVTQQNLLNASTPGYARQRATLQALPYEPERGQLGGVRAASLGSARSAYAEQAVWQEVQSHARVKQFSTSLENIEPLLSAEGNQGVPGAFREFFAAAAYWSGDSNGEAARDNFVRRAEGAALAFSSAAEHLEWTRGVIDAEVQNTVSEINTILGRLDKANQQQTGIAQGGVAEAQIYSDLERLAELTGFTAGVRPDGTVSVYSGGQTALLLDGSVNTLKSVTMPNAGETVANPQAVAPMHIVDSNGRDLTSQVNGGKLAGLLDARAQIDSLIGTVHQQGDLNILAERFAGRVNEILTSGTMSAAPGAASGQPMFAYSTQPTAVASTLKIAEGFTPIDLSVQDPGPPPVENGVPLQIAALMRGVLPENTIDGSSFPGYYSVKAAQIALILGNAKDEEAYRSELVDQVQRFRSDISGVSVEEEAVTMLEIQRSYEATAKVITVLDEMLETTIALVR